MKTAKYEQFYFNLVNTVNNLNSTVVKSAIGDSTNNNRVLTVNQLIRFLSTRRTTSNKLLAASLQNVYNNLRPTLDILRKVHTDRTDAIDINEFLNYYAGSVLFFGDKTTRKAINKVI